MIQWTGVSDSYIPHATCFDAKLYFSKSEHLSTNVLYNKYTFKFAVCTCWNMNQMRLLGQWFTVLHASTHLLVYTEYIAGDPKEMP